MYELETTPAQAWQSGDWFVHADDKGPQLL